jgi:hypothetical protein
VTIKLLLPEGDRSIAALDVLHVPPIQEPRLRTRPFLASEHFKLFGADEHLKDAPSTAPPRANNNQSAAPKAILRSLVLTV